MINFRYHLISLMAVFLSLTLGIALGATVVDKAVTDSLESRINEVSRAKQATDVKNLALTQANQRETKALESLSGAAVRGHLTNSNVAVVAMRGVDDATIESTIKLLQTAGADAPAVIWLEPKWALTTSSQRADLRAAIGSDVADGDLVSQGLKMLASRLADTSTGSRRDDAIVALDDAGFVSVDAKGERGRSDLVGFPRGGTVMALVGMGFNLDDAAYAETFTKTLSDSLESASLRVVIGERDSNPEQFPERAGALKLVRASTTVSTVDSMDLIQGQIAAVLAIEAVGNGVVGHFGYGPGASSAMPEP